MAFQFRVYFVQWGRNLAYFYNLNTDARNQDALLWIGLSVSNALENNYMGFHLRKKRRQRCSQISSGFGLIARLWWKRMHFRFCNLQVKQRPIAICRWRKSCFGMRKVFLKFSEAFFKFNEITTVPVGTSFSLTWLATTVPSKKILRWAIVSFVAH